MVLAELGVKLKEAFDKLKSAEYVDKKLLIEVLNAVSMALLKSDVKLAFVSKLKKNVEEKFNQIEEESGNKRIAIKRAVVQELQTMLTAARKPYVPKKGKSNVIMFVGLQGSGKTTTCTKYAYYYHKKGWKVGLVCADTFRAGAFDQLKQNATKCKIPFYGSYTEMDPVKTAQEGVIEFKKKKFDMIIIDTSGKHRQESALFEEMKQVAEVTTPDDIIFVMDSHIGQACFDQALAFKNSVDIGSVIITKLESHAKGGGALAAVAATESPITFIGTGEHFEDFEEFSPKGFIGKLLGEGDIKGLFEKVKEVINPDQQKKLMDNLQKGEFSLRSLKEQYHSVLKMGPLDKVVSMIPGLTQEMIPKGQEKEASKKIKKYLYMMDSMTNDELDGKVKLTEDKIKRIAKGSGTLILEVKMLLEEHKKFEMMIKNLNKVKGKGLDSKDPNKILSTLKGSVPEDMLSKMGGAENIMNMVKQMGGAEGLGGLAKQLGGGKKGKR